MTMHWVHNSALQVQFCLVPDWHVFMPLHTQGFSSLWLPSPAHLLGTVKELEPFSFPTDGIHFLSLLSVQPDTTLIKAFQLPSRHQSVSIWLRLAQRVGTTVYLCTMRFSNHQRGQIWSWKRVSRRMSFTVNQDMKAWLFQQYMVTHFSLVIEKIS